MQKGSKIICIFLLILTCSAHGQEKVWLPVNQNDSILIEPTIKPAKVPDTNIYTGPVILKAGMQKYRYANEEHKKWVVQTIQKPVVKTLLAPDTIPAKPLISEKQFSPYAGNNTKSAEQRLTPSVNKALPPRYKDNAVINVKYYDIKQGLSNSYIYDIYEDKDGLLWLATNGGGVCKFDGEEFSILMRDNGLTDNMVKAIAADSSDNLWFATMNGASYYDKNNFTNFTKNQGLNGRELNDVIADQNNNIWFAGENSGITVLKNKQILYFNQKQGISDNIATIHEDQNGNIWIGTYDKGIFQYNGRYFMHYSAKHGLADNCVFDISSNQNNHIFIGTEKGLNILKNNKVVFYGEKQGLPSVAVNVVYPDDGGGVLLGTNGGGLSRLSRGTITSLNSSEGLSNDEIWAIHKDQSNIFWIGTWGGGLNRYDGYTFIHYTKEQGLPANIIPAITNNKQNELWFGSFGNGFFNLKNAKFHTYHHAQGFDAETVWSMIFDRQNKLWIATRNNGLWVKNNDHFEIYNTKNGFPDNGIWSLLEDHEGNIWIGTRDEGIFRYNGKYFTAYPITQKLILSIFEDSKNNIWIATWGDGIFKIKNNRYQHFTPDDKFPASKVYNFYEDPNGYIWFATSGEGAVIYNERHFEKITQKDGLSSNITYWIKKINSNHILLGSENGLNELVPTKKSEPTYPDSGFVRTYTDSATQQKMVEIDGNHYAINTYGISEGFTGHDCVGSQYSALKTAEGTLWIGTGNQLTQYNPAYEITDTIPPKVHIKAIDLFLQPIDWQKKSNKITQKDKNEENGEKISFDSLDQAYKIPLGLKLPHNKNHISIDFIAINWKDPQNTIYQYQLQGYEESWNYPTKRSHAIYANLPPGNYTFRVKAMNNDKYWSEPAKFNFTIKTPWWQTWWFQVSVFIAAVLLIVGVIRLRLRSLKAQKDTLEKMVKERTQEIMQQKEEIQTQRDNLNQINTQLERLSIVARETHNGVLIADFRGNIEWINEGYTNLLGYTLETLKTNKGINLFFINRNEKTLAYIKKCRDNKAPVTFSSLYEKADHQKIWLQTTITPILDKENNIKKYVVIYADITSLKKAQEQIEKHNKEITASIRYASHIQSSVLPLRSQIRNSELESFIIYKPKDIVGGDFYWFSRHGSNYLTGVIDCTGHGVPGAFMTVIAYTVISRIVNDENAANPAILLSLMNKHVKRMLKQHATENGNSDDGLDASFCYIMPQQAKIRFAGAKQPLFHSWSDEISEIKGDRQSIGYISSDEAFQYTNHLIDIRHNSVFYLTSDGYKDMSVDNDGHILGKKKFRELLRSLGGKSMDEQHRYLQRIMEKSVEKNGQFDDITIFAFKLPEKYHAG